MDIKDKRAANLAFVAKHMKKKTTSWIARQLGVATRTVREYKEAISVGKIKKEVSAKDEVKADMVARSFRENEKFTNEKYKIAIEKNRVLEDALEAALQLKVVTSHKIVATKEDSGEATAFMVASDWHVEEEVTAGQVSGVNSYNLELARSRADKFFVNGVKLVKIFQKDTHIKNVVVPLLGDFITGNLHEDSAERNLLGSMQAMAFAQELIVSGIKYLLKETDCKLTFVCHSGNHGRITKKIHWGNENLSSLEWVMYCTIANLFKEEKRCTFVIPEGDMSYLPVYGMRVRFIHGHQVKFGGGIGGITTPMRKAISQWDRVQQADLTLFGHFHQRIDGGNFIGNGSLIGYNAYAQAMKCEYEVPAQQFFLISNKNNGVKTVVVPIWLD